ncbi:MAG: DUF1924 domain-containing protein [Gammaproteobacteria bacterium]
MRYLLISGVLWLVAGAVQAAAVDDLLAEYRQAGAAEFSAERGRTLWDKRFPDPKQAGKTRSCSLCHGDDLRQGGKHVRTGKAIKPMAPSVNSARLSDVKKVRKWLKRNCKWTLGRECSPQEKGDLLTFLRSQ